MGTNNDKEDNNNDNDPDNIRISMASKVKNLFDTHHYISLFVCMIVCHTVVSVVLCVSVVAYGGVAEVERQTHTQRERKRNANSHSTLIKFELEI